VEKYGIDRYFDVSGEENTVGIGGRRSWQMADLY
jgi:predicted secreted protein